MSAAISKNSCHLLLYYPADEPEVRSRVEYIKERGKSGDLVLEVGYKGRCRVHPLVRELWQKNITILMWEGGKALDYSDNQEFLWRCDLLSELRHRQVFILMPREYLPEEIDKPPESGITRKVYDFFNEMWDLKCLEIW